MNDRRIPVCVLGVLLVACGMSVLGGCEDPAAQTPAPAVPKGLTMTQLADSLDMTLVQSDGNRAILAAGVNRVVIRRTPREEIYVNGRKLKVATHVLVAKEMLVVDFAVSDAIRAALPKASSCTDPWVTISDKPTKPLVVLDPAHGGVDAGSVCAGLWMEKKVTLGVATEIAKLLRARGIDVEMTRDGDVYRSVNTRSEWIRGRQPALVLTLHTDMGTTGGAVYFPRRCDEGSTSYEFAASLAKRLGHTGSAKPNDPTQHTYHGTLIEKVSATAALVDLGSSRDEQDAARLASGPQRILIAKTIAAAIAAHLAADAHL